MKAKTFILKVRMESSALTEDGKSELARILRNVAMDIEESVEDGVKNINNKLNIFDSNGNKIGYFYSSMLSWK